jgi:DDE superfamily endonuclease
MEMLEEGHIALLDNGWTDNELGLEWLKQCFNPATIYITNEYRILIIDGHASHITTEALQFYIASKIIVLCLPAHTTHLLQPLDVGPFRPLATAYKAGVQERGYLNAIYNVNKLEFLEIYKTARLRGISKENIMKGWRNSGLQPFDSKVVLDLLPKQLSTLDSTPDSAPDSAPDSTQIPTTPANIKEVELLFNRIFQGNPSLDTLALSQLQKLQKGACKAIASAETHRITNDRLLEVAKAENKRGKRNKGNRKDCNYGRVMGIEVIEQRRQFAKEKEFLKAWKEDFTKIGPDIFTALKGKSLAKRAIKASLPIKRKALEAIELGAIELGPKKKPRTEELEKETEEVEALRARTRAGRVVKRTSKVRNKA